MKLISRTTALLAVAMCGMAHAAIISQSNNNTTSGGANYGQRFELNSTLITEQTLQSISFNKGPNGGGSSTLYLDIYAIGTATIGSIDFSSNSTTGLNYLGSSDNSINYSSATNGSELTWTFSSITLPQDVALFAVFSSDGVDGNYVGTSVQNANSGSYTNISNAISDPLYGGDAEANNGDNFYEISVIPEPSSVIPEPSSLALLTIAGLLIDGLLIARRRRA